MTQMPKDEKPLSVEQEGKRFHIPVDSTRILLDEIKARQQARMADGIPATPTLKDLYRMGLDILENQAQIENKLNKLINK